MLRTLSLILLVFALSTSVFGQTKPIKRKYRGVYEGKIPAYEVRMGQDVYSVKATTLRILLDRDSIFLEIGTNRYASAYFIENKENKYILTSPRDHSGIPEQFILDPKAKTMIRKGLYPQPDASLTRSGKLPRR
ncbi:MAG: hypothetical protein RL331_1022 [Bacteroidota bacterium]|jgi:hypothetical protein